MVNRGVLYCVGLRLRGYGGQKRPSVRSDDHFVDEDDLFCEELRPMYTSAHVETHVCTPLHASKHALKHASITPIAYRHHRDLMRL